MGCIFTKPKPNIIDEDEADGVTGMQSGVVDIPPGERDAQDVEQAEQDVEDL